MGAEERMVEIRGYGPTHKATTVGGWGSDSGPLTRVPKSPEGEGRT